MPVPSSVEGPVLSSSKRTLRPAPKRTAGPALSRGESGETVNFVNFITSAAPSRPPRAFAPPARSAAAPTKDEGSDRSDAMAPANGSILSLPGRALGAGSREAPPENHVTLMTFVTLATPRCFPRPPSLSRRPLHIFSTSGGSGLQAAVGEGRLEAKRNEGGTLT
jgi:hypothetical protein